MGMPVGDSDGWANCSCRFSLTSKGMCSVSCLLDLDRAVVPHHTSTPARAASATPLLDRVGQTLRFQVFFFSCGLGMRDPSPPAVISLLASRIPCFQGADSQFNPPVRCAQAVFVRVHTRCCHPRGAPSLAHRHCARARVVWDSGSWGPINMLGVSGNAQHQFKPAISVLGACQA